MSNGVGQGAFWNGDPHYYVQTTPYRGCAICGVGPGAFVHNTYEVERFILARFLGMKYVPGQELELA